MTEVGLGVGSGGGGGGGSSRGLVHTPDSDCNSNHPRSASVLSNTSSQDIDFIQDNSDYQWFLDYGYRDNHHTSILSLPESYEAADIGYYDTLAKNLDANLAEADIESFRTEDIHALLTNLPPMCSDQSSQDSNREGESYASVSNSMLGKFDFDSSSPHSSSQGEEDSTSMSICKSELLFSPVKESMPMLPMPNFSVDSLDCDLLNEHDIMLTCQANKDNYTIAFEGSVTMYSEDSDYHEADKSETSGGDGSAHWRPEMLKEQMQPALNQQESMTQSDSSSFTTWSKLKKRCSDQQLRHLPSGNNNQSGDELTNSFLDADPAAKSRSMPNLYKQKLRGLVAHNYQARSNQLSNSSVECCTTIKRRPVKVFDIQHQSTSGESGSLVSDMATSADQNTTSSSKQHPQNFNLVKLFMKQKSISAEGMSTGLDQSSDWSGESSAQNQKLDDSKGSLNNNNHDLEVKRRVMRTRSTNTRNSRNVGLSSSSSTASSFTKSKHVPMHLMNKSIQTSECKESKIKVVPPSFLNKLKKEGEIQKPVYVCYPNYVLPNLDFLNETTDKVVFVPQKVSASKALSRTNKRPFSCSDVEALKKKGFSHVQDWDSLNFLLPNECRKILADVPEVASYGQNKDKPSFKKSSDFSDDVSSSSGYRGSSSLLAEEQQQLQQQQQQQQQFNPLFVYRYDSATSSAASSAPPLPKRSISLDAPPRPPLPRGILRKDRQEEEPFKLRRKKLSETEDEGFDASTSSVESVLFSKEELNQLEEFLKMSAVSSDHDDMNDESMLQLRSCVSKFLALKINQDRKCVSFAGNVKNNVAPNNSPNVSALLTQRFTQGKTLVEMPICEEAESSEFSPQRKAKNPKCSLISDVCDSVGKIVQGFSSATDQGELKVLCDSTMNPRSAKLVLNTLCPALYAVLSDGLKPSLETSFGAIGNSVWQVIEASAQQGPLTKALNELVMRINSEDVITEGVVKFNALVFGLLNVRSLDAWFSYLRTRESILRKHYAPDSLLVQSHTGGTETRALLDTLITSLQPLALFPFQFDLLFEYRLLHESLKRMDSYQQPPSPSHKIKSVEDVLPDLLSTSPPKPAVRLSKQRPRSCVDPKPAFKIGEDVNTVLKKRWSGINMSSKLFTAYNRLAHENSEEEYTDSLETSPPTVVSPPKQLENVIKMEEAPESLDSNFSLDEKPLNGKKFKKLQRKWEMLSGKEQSPPDSPTHGNKSKIPRPVSSPSSRPSGIPVAVSPTKKIAPPVKKAVTPPGNKPAKFVPKSSPAKKTTPSRTSRLDQLEDSPQKHHPARPSSLPYKPAAAERGKAGKITPPRRAVSTSVNRKPLAGHPTPKVVRTLSHRLPTESGHLSYNEGERLKVVLEVDERWLLCCRGTQKGLVPRDAVIADSGRF
ncbi:PREDICTED: uncharacterized protein LOC108563887 [Nicrophorus vespilloides]|uniref:Uncharacterized protein LOC108563887 n=1 Tax=Nicrophorus vespilloides TaxID=110193 RepID=A0ABM1MUD0_NICVS|nr:PREDICTED: uncharacterized protein LOC108563887 [Nicrophorus vespilloides]